MGESEETNKYVLGALDLHVKGGHLDDTFPAKFFLDYQKELPVWAQVEANALALFGLEIEVRAPGILEPFEATMSGARAVWSHDSFLVFAEVRPMKSLIESVPATDLTQVAFALLDSPITGDLVPEQRRAIITYPCAQFDIIITRPNEPHIAVREALGYTPHILSDSATITDRDKRPFDSKSASLVLDTLHSVLSFAAGHWVGITLVEGTGPGNTSRWFRWGTTSISGTHNEDGWYDPMHPEWLEPLPNALIDLMKVEDTWEPIRVALYWYIRSNTRGAGIDSSLILSQCALELLSWFVIVKKFRALSETGYGQLNDAAEKLRLALTLLGIPKQIPLSLSKMASATHQWKDVAEAIVQGRNYLVHPTQSRSGKRQPKRDYPFFELWVASQWVLELVILRLLGYSGDYRNRTRRKDFNPVERVPWAR